MPTVTLTGQSAVAYAGNLRISSSDWHEFFYEQQLIVDTSATALKTIEGQSSTSALGEITKSGAGFAEITGVEVIASLGTAIFSGTENVSVLISGQEMTIAPASISAGVENPVVWSSGKLMRYPANAFKYANVTLLPVQSYSSIGDVYASGTTVVSVNATVSGIELFTDAGQVLADGVLSISDEELIVLLAA